ncbi:hypothetical protein V6N13_124235 [Hibiscus sabdariffa]
MAAILHSGSGVGHSFAEKSSRKSKGSQTATFWSPLNTIFTPKKLSLHQSFKKAKGSFFSLLAHSILPRIRSSCTVEGHRLQPLVAVPRCGLVQVSPFKRLGSGAGEHVVVAERLDEGGDVGG